MVATPLVIPPASIELGLFPKTAVLARRFFVLKHVMNNILQCGAQTLDLSRPRIMGILNVTPDSFSDGGRDYVASAHDCAQSVVRALAMIEEGADIIDVGGESTRPGAAPVSVQQEMDRVLPVVEALVSDGRAIISVDTSSPEVMREAILAGAGMINDVRALRVANALSTVAESNVALCLMHMRGEPQTMQQATVYDDVVADVAEFLRARVEACCAAGIARSRIVVDPGFGFGKNLQHNLRLLAQLELLNGLAQPLLVGLSRKSAIGAVTGRDVSSRLAGSIACAVLALERGAKILRVHDVAPTRDAIAMTLAVLKENDA
jgi:dihydropteroate synthase